MTILRSQGPVISTRRSRRSQGAGATCQLSVPHGARLGEEVELGARVDCGLALLSGAEQLLAARVEAAVKAGDEGHRLRTQDRRQL